MRVRSVFCTCSGLLEKKDTRCKFVAKKANWKTSAVSVTQFLPLGIAVYADLPPVGDLKWD